MSPTIFADFPLGGAHLHSLLQNPCFQMLGSVWGQGLQPSDQPRFTHPEQWHTTIVLGRLLRGWPCSSGFHPVTYSRWRLGQFSQGLREAHGTQLYLGLDSAHHFGLPFAQQVWEGPASMYPCSLPPHLPNREAGLSLGWHERRAAKWSSLAKGCSFLSCGLFICLSFSPT